MPYIRPKVIPPESVLVAKFESGIRSLVRRFRNHPYAFYTESDMHCYLYHRLYSQGTFNGLYKTHDGHDTILLHKEYPTVARYRRQYDNKLESDPTGHRRGAFDICIWDPANVQNTKHREQKVLCAAELALNECGKNNVHTINDATKLADPVNNITHGYLLFFVRDDSTYEKNKMKIKQQLRNASKAINVVFVRVHGENKPVPDYMGNWI